jgi:hypothetical protein
MAPGCSPHQHREPPPTPQRRNISTLAIAALISLVLGCERTKESPAVPAPATTPAPLPGQAPDQSLTAVPTPADAVAPQSAPPAPPPLPQPQPPDPTPATEPQKIEALLARFAAANAVFIRNGTEYDGASAAAHLRSKWSAGGDRIATARDFIFALASTSSMSGKPYYVRTSTGQTIESRSWFTDLVVEIEQSKEPRPSPTPPP